MALQKPVTVKEMTFAYNFLKRLGANLSNAYLFTAVVAWLRVGAGYNMSNVTGNNPLLQRVSGKLVRFSSLAAAARAAADAVRSASKGTAGGFYTIRIIAQRNPTGSGAELDTANQQQARDFMQAIALSKWNASHYGESTYVAGHNVRTPEGIVSVPGYWTGVTPQSYDETRNQIALLWQGITGKLPKIIIGTTQPKQVKPPIPPPMGLNPPHGIPNYLDPYETRWFYRASRPKSDLGNLPTV